MRKISIKTDFITLGQLLKMTDLISSGGEAKIFLLSHNIYVNSEAETRRGRKLKIGDEVLVLGQKFIIG